MTKQDKEALLLKIKNSEERIKMLKEKPTEANKHEIKLLQELILSIYTRGNKHW